MEHPSTPRWDVPLRALVTERRTLQRTLATFNVAYASVFIVPIGARNGRSP